MVKSATGVAESPSNLMICITGCGSVHCVTDTSAPSAMDHGSGLLSAPRSALSRPSRQWPAPSLCASARHSELVKKRSASTVMITGPAARSPASATSRGTPMKPVFGKAAISAPKAESLSPRPQARLWVVVTNTTNSAAPIHNASHTGLKSCPIGVLAPKRNSMHGSAKKST